MKLHNRLSLLALIAAASLAFTACDDGEDNLPVETCEENPAQDKCEQPVTCEEDPTQEKCQQPVTCEEDPTQEQCAVDCEANPEAEGCGLDCDANPGAIACLPTDCTQLTAPDTTVCDADTVKAVAAHALRFRSETATALPTVVIEELAAGERVLTIDARLGTSATAACQPWLYLNLATGELLDLSDTDAVTNSEWHLAFKRSEIRTNTGNSGPSHAQLAQFENTAFADVTCVGQSAFSLTDDFVNAETCEVATYGRDTPSTAFGQWYDYDFTTHQLSPQNTTYAQYFVGGHGRAVKFKIESMENNGTYTIRVAPVSLGTTNSPCPE